MITQGIVRTLVAASENPLAALAVKATVAMLAALFLIRLARGASASLRHLLAAATFGVLLLLPLAALLVPARAITVTPTVAARETTEAAAIPAAPVPSRASAAPAVRPPVDLATAAYGLYLLGVVGFATAPLVGIWKLHRVRNRADVSVEGTRRANEMARQEGLAGGIEVAVSSELAVPITFGWTHAVILLPAETVDWDEPERERALRHELEHVARGDWAAHLCSRAALALYWPHPIAWMLWRRLRLEAERACDDAVIRSQGQPVPYAEQLVSLARRLGGRGVVPALSMATRSNLGLRVEAILDERQRRAPRSRLVSLGVAGAAMAGLLAIAPFQVVGANAPLADEPALGDDDDEGDPLDVALMEAARKGNIASMQRLLERGAKADAVIRGDGTPLIGAARGGNQEAIELLLASGADVNRGVDGDGNPLTMAAQAGHLDAVRLLLDRGADVDRGVPGDGNALIMAAGHGQLEVVRFLLERGASLEKVVPGDENALIHASESGQAAVVRFLIERGANVNARVWAEAGPHRGRGEWRTALLMARRNGHHEVVRLLLAAGARE